MSNEAVLKMINKRIDDLYDSVDSLATSYKVLNDSHGSHELAITNRVTAVETEWKTHKSWFKFIFGTSLAGTLISLLTVLRMFGVL